MCRHFQMKWSAEVMLMRPCKDHLALEEGALPKAAELCIAIPGNVDKEHFILEKTLLLVLFIFHFQATGWILNWLCMGQGKQYRGDW